MSDRGHGRPPAPPAHTVRDHVKAVPEKAGVSSRGELVAKLFAEHHAPMHFAAGGHDAVDG